MIKSKTETCLQELNDEIAQIVKGYSENDTSYFPNATKLLQAFENYLQCIDNYQSEIKNYFPNQIFSLFKQEVSLKVLMTFQRFVNLLLEWDFRFKDSLVKILKQISFDENQINRSIFSQISVVQIVFLMYLCLEVERKEIIGKGFKNGQSRMFLLRQILKILQEFSQNNEENVYNANREEQQSPFIINEEKLVKIILLKTLKLKLQKQNFSFGPKRYKDELKSSSRQCLKENINVLNKKSDKNIQNNISLVSVRSEFEQSQVIEQKVQRMKQSIAVLPLKLNPSQYGLQMKNLSNEDIFHYISLNQFKGYITQ